MHMSTNILTGILFEGTIDSPLLDTLVPGDLSHQAVLPIKRSGLYVENLIYFQDIYYSLLLFSIS